MSRAALRQLLNTIDWAEPARRRAVQQAILEAQAWYWGQRAEQFHGAAPKPTDYNGHATAEDLLEAKERCLATARACWNHAHTITQLQEEGDAVE